MRRRLNIADITLTKEQYAKLPYKGTAINRGKTYGEIIGLLENHGIHDYQWTKFQGTEVLAFPLKIKRRDVEVGFMVKLTVPKLMFPIAKGKGYNKVKTLTYLENESWRIFWWHLKSKLEAIEFGISDEVKEFMYNIAHALPDGREISLGEMIRDNLQQLDKLALTDETSRKIIDVEMV